MRFRCDSCGAQYAIADEKLGKKGVRVRCKKCSEIITVRPSAGEAEPMEQGVTDPAAQAPRDEERDQTAVDNPEQSARAAAAGSGEGGFDLGEDADLNNALDDILGGEDGGLGDDEEDGGDANLDRQATRVFNVEEMQQVQAEREAAYGPDEEESAASGQAGQESEDDARGPAEAEEDSPSDEARERVEWYAAVDEEQVGPFSLIDFKARWERGEFSTETLVWKTGFEDWLPVYEVPELAFLAEEPAAAKAEAGDWSADGDADEDWDRDSAAAVSGMGADADETEHDGDDDSDDSDEGYDEDEDEDSYYDDDDDSSASASASADAFAGAEVDWKPSALSALSASAEEELSALRPEEPEPDLEDEGLPFDGEEGLPDADEEALGGDAMEDGDSSLISQIAAEEEAAAKREEEERLVREREAEEQRRKEEEAALAAQEAASREKREEQRDKVLPPEERYIPPRSSLPKWAIGLMVGGGVLLLLVVGFLGITLYKLSSGPVDQVNNAVQPVAPPGAQPLAQPVAQPAPGPGDQAGAQTPGQPAAKPDDQAAASPAGPTDQVAAAAVVPANPEQPKADPPKADQPKPAIKKDPTISKPAKRKKTRRTEPKPKVAAIEKKEDPPPKEDPKPVRKKPKGGILDFEDPDDRAFAAETGAKAKAPAPAVEKKKTELPPLTNAAVYSVMKQHLEEFKACNRTQKERDASVKGRMVVSFTINPDGRVASAGVKTAEFKSTFVAGCITGIIKRLKFPPFGGGPKQLPFPFTVK